MILYIIHLGKHAREDLLWKPEKIRHEKDGAAVYVGSSPLCTIFVLSVFTDHDGMFLVFNWLRMIRMLLDAVYNEVQKMQKHITCELVAHPLPLADSIVTSFSRLNFIQWTYPLVSMFQDSFAAINWCLFLFETTTDNNSNHGNWNLTFSVVNSLFQTYQNLFIYH